jgi:SAM-dependent methyltransferase
MDESESQITYLLGVLQERVEARRAEGVYAPGLEEELDEHFRRIAAHRVEPNIDDVREVLERLEGAMHFAMERIDLGSNMPGGDRLHRALAKAQARQIVGVLGQVSQFADIVRDALAKLADAVESPESHVHPDLVGQLDAVLERVAGYERMPLDSPAALADLRHRVEELEAKERAREFRPFYTNDRFEETFRGSRDELRFRYQDLARQFDGLGPVVDIGCGRGEFLELLSDRGIEASGIEMDPELVADARSNGLKVELGDGLEFLRQQEDGSLGGIVLIQVIEHLSSQGVLDLVLLARDKLREGGRIICETVNPQSLYVFGHSFYADPTHVRPVHPAYLSFLFSEADFSGVQIEWRSPPPADEVLEVPGGDPVATKNAERLNALLFAPQDFAVIATR